MGSTFVRQLNHIVDYLYSHLALVGWQWWVLSIVVSAILIVAYLHGRRGCAIHKYQVVALALLGMYVTILLSMTVLAREPKTTTMSANLDVLGTWARRFGSVGELKTEVVINSIMLLPFGILLPLVTGCGLGSTFVWAFVLTIAIEVAQFVSFRGWFELSDLVLNVLGAFVGYGVYALSMRLATHSVNCALARYL